MNAQTNKQTHEQITIKIGANSKANHKEDVTIMPSNMEKKQPNTKWKKTEKKQLHNYSLTLAVNKWKCKNIHITFGQTSKCLALFDGYVEAIRDKVLRHSICKCSVEFSMKWQTIQTGEYIITSCSFQLSVAHSVSLTL